MLAQPEFISLFAVDADAVGVAHESVIRVLCVWMILTCFQACIAPSTALLCHPPAARSQSTFVSHFNID